MSWYGSGPDISGWACPGSHVVSIETICVDEGEECEVTSGYMCLTVWTAHHHDMACVLLDVKGAKQLRRQLSQFIRWRESKGVQS